MPHTLTIDPGLDGTGVAVWGAEGVAPVAVFTIHPRAAMLKVPDRLEASGVSSLLSWAWVGAGEQLGVELNLQLEQFDPISHVYCEWPALFGGASGHIAAARGDLGKIYWACGIIARVAAQHRAHFYPVPVAVWKGQLPKPIVVSRCKQRLGPAAARFKDCDEHSWDAIGLGLWAVRGVL